MGPNISGFSIDNDLTFTFDTGGAIAPSGGNTPVSALLVADSAGDSIIGNAQKEEV